MFLSEKYCPKKFDQFILNKNKIRLVKCNYKKETEEFNNILIYGPPSSGKYTLALSILHDIYGDGIYNRKLEELTLKVGNNNTKNVFIKHSKYHFEVLVNKYVFNDRNSLSAFLSTIDTTKNVQTNSFNIVIIRNIDKLSYEMLEYFKRGLESKHHTIRIIGISCNTSKLTNYCNRFCKIRISSPNNKELCDFTKFVSDKENLNLTPEKIEEVVKFSQRDINKLMIILEHIQINPNYIYIDYLEEEISKIMKLMLSKNPENVLVIRENLYNLSCNNIKIMVIVRKIINQLLNLNISNEKKHIIVNKVAEFDYNICKSYKEIIHLEALLINIMYLLTKS